MGMKLLLSWTSRRGSLLLLRTCSDVSGGPNLMQKIAPESIQAVFDFEWCSSIRAWHH